MRKATGAAALLAGLAAVVLAARSTDIAGLLARVPLGGVLVLGGLVLLMAGLVLLATNSRSVRTSPSPMRVLSVWWIVGGLMGVAVSTWIATAALTAIAGADPALRLDAIKSGLTVGAGAAGGVALLLGVRRQWLGERTQVYQEYDATEKRVTELYSKAVDQLGSGNPGVRIAAMYALERLGRNNPEHRQAVMDVLCAYLRAPLPTGAVDDPVDRAREPAGDAAGAGDHAPGREHSPDLEARLTAQRIVVRHLKSSGGTYGDDGDHWPGVAVDLTRASLVDFDVSGSEVEAASFAQAVFSGRTAFTDCRFRGRADFTGAEFRGFADFGTATFFGADFAGAGFRGGVSFAYALFRFDTDFGGATFTDADFGGARFGTARFAGASFDGLTSFENSEFFAGHFEGVTFDGGLDFGSAIFRCGVRFRYSDFAGPTSFAGTFFGRAGFRHCAFLDDASFAGAASRGIAYKTDPEAAAVRFEAEHKGLSVVQRSIRAFTVRVQGGEPRGLQRLDLADTHFKGSVDFGGADIGGGELSGVTFPRTTATVRVWPPAWCEVPDPADPARGTVARSAAAPRR
ncbi:pentapeptide repeat-containing protein [Microbispora sp. KK1-11]|uniref:pentapeptide repeat-containing protein n=1 Tax=Microbispora sp. KK1-11 TaxID=2053005 RepID=UPI001159BEC0|nr:pentapeptide repeat-containing protein [Microbispora sp. KK1-11]TQS25688.1 pentapeptide repeat-containing protein [Microbispora sp. KK1-11]